MKPRRLTLWCPQFRNRHGGIQQFSRLVDEGLRSIRNAGSCRTLELSGGAAGKASFLFRASIDAAFRRPGTVLITHLHLGRLSPLLRLLRIPYWICAHGIECWSPDHMGDRRILKGAALVLCVSRYTESRLLSALPELRGKTRILPNHVEDLGPSTDRATARNLLGLPREGRMLLTVSRLSSAERYKGHREILCILPKALAGHPDLFYVIAGDGDDRKDLQDLASRMGVADRVYFTGPLDDAGLEAAYAAADALVMPSTGEGFGIVFLEALVRGIPVLAGNRDGSRDPLQDGELGVLVDPEDPDSLLNGLLELLARSWDPQQLSGLTLARFGVRLLGPRLYQLLEDN